MSDIRRGCIGACLGVAVAFVSLDPKEMTNPTLAMLAQEARSLQRRAEGGRTVVSTHPFG